MLFRLENLTARIKPEDTFIFYFSGHGMVRDGEHYLLSINSDPRSLTTLAVTAIPLQRLQQLLGQIRAHQIVVILDACRNDPEPGKGDADNILTDELVRGIRVKPLQQVGGQAICVATFYASSLGERAYEWQEKSSGVFTYYMIRGLRGEAADVQNRVTIRGLADYVIKRVSEWSIENGKQQTPWLVTEGAADIVLAVLPRTTQTSATLHIDSIPPGANVYVDDVLYGQTPIKITVDTGINGEKMVEITVTLEGYITKYGKMKLSAEQESSWNAILDIERVDLQDRSLFKLNSQMLFRSLAFPGLGQYYAGRNISGSIFFASALASVTGAAVAHIQYDRSLDRYRDSVSRYRDAATTDAVIEAKQTMIGAHDDAVAKFRFRRAAYIVLGSLWVSNVLHSLIVGPAVASTDYAPQVSSSGWNIEPDITPYAMRLSVQYAF